jgi:hypothetical protein
VKYTDARHRIDQENRELIEEINRHKEKNTKSVGELSPPQNISFNGIIEEGNTTQKAFMN